MSFTPIWLCTSWKASTVPMLSLEVHHRNCRRSCVSSPNRRYELDPQGASASAWFEKGSVPSAAQVGEAVVLSCVFVAAICVRVQILNKR